MDPCKSKVSPTSSSAALSLPHFNQSFPTRYLRNIISPLSHCLRESDGLWTVYQFLRDVSRVVNQ